MGEVLLPGSRACAFLLLRRAGENRALAIRLPLRCFPTFPPPPPPRTSVGTRQPLLQHPPRRLLLPSNSPPDPHNLGTRRQRDHARHPLANRLPLHSFPPPYPIPPSFFCGQAVTTARSLAASPPSPLQLSTSPPFVAPSKPPPLRKTPRGAIAGRSPPTRRTFS